MRQRHEGPALVRFIGVTLLPFAPLYPACGKVAHDTGSEDTRSSNTRTGSGGVSTADATSVGGSSTEPRPSASGGTGGAPVSSLLEACPNLLDQLPCSIVTLDARNLTAEGSCAFELETPQWTAPFVVIDCEIVDRIADDGEGGAAGMDATEFVENWSWDPDSETPLVLSSSACDPVRAGARLDVIFDCGICK